VSVLFVFEAAKDRERYTEGDETEKAGEVDEDEQPEKVADEDCCALNEKKISYGIREVKATNARSTSCADSVSCIAWLGPLWCIEVGARIRAAQQEKEDPSKCGLKG